MTDRKTASSITDDALTALYDQLDALRAVARGYCPECGRGDAAPTVADWEQQRQRAETAERQRDQYTSALGAVLALFPADCDPGGPAQAGRRAPAALINRWRSLLPQPVTDCTPPPPGDTREQLPDHLLAIIDIPTYLSTACEAADLLARQMPKYTHRCVELGEHADRLHSHCRLQNKFTGAICRCHCHTTTKEN